MADPNTILTTLSRGGWQVVRNRQPVDLLPYEVRKRYPRLPADIESFLGELDSCSNSNETVWFLTHADFRRNQDGEFRWNEHELMCLEAAEGDVEEIERIRAYWDYHFPFMFAVHSDYDYLAVDLNPDVFGQVVHGFMPEPEESSRIAGSFAEFVDMLISSLTGRAEYPLSIFV